MSPARGDSKEYVLTEPQVKRIINDLTIARDRALFGLLTFGGMRIGEAVHIRPNWMKGPDEVVIPATQLCKCKECAARRNGLWKPKTAAGIRTVTVPNWVWNETRDIVTEDRGLGITRVGAWHRVKKILSTGKISMPGLASDTSFPHALRATCATLLAANGADAGAIAYHMGWNDLRVANKYIQMAQSKNLAHKQVKAIFG